jgi:two-component system nitrogen regulation sensor histidine kinase NtrY
MVEINDLARQEELRALRKKRRIWWIIAVCLLLMVGLTYLETLVLELGTVDFPVSGNVLVYVLINFNVLLLLLTVFLVLRNLVQLVFDRKRKILGTKLRTKLVISFMSMALIPTSILFFLALQFVSTSMDYWFNINVEQALEESLDIARNVYQEERHVAARLGRNIALQLESKRYRQLTETTLDIFLDDIVESRGLASLALLGEDRQVKMVARASDLKSADLPAIPESLIRKGLKGEKDLDIIQKSALGELVRNVTLVRLGSASQEPHILVTSLLIPQDKIDQLHKISAGLEGYRQLILLQQPIKTSLLVILLIVTLLVMFAAIWFGFYVAAGLTTPIGKLAEATVRVADGELDFVIDKESGDEMGTLVESFNKMTRDLLIGQRNLEQFNLELENRRRYTETILQNVPAGVVSLDRDGRITSINTFAEKLLKIQPERLIGHRYTSVLAPQHSAILDQFYAELARTGKMSMEMPLQLSVGNETFSLRVNITRLHDESGEELGVVLVFDNLTELEKAQRMAAWREVARRIAHEVKNPLTPIQLSAQRLRKRYLDKLAGEGDIFDLCTKTIISQVDELKHLVSEFSSFARMPAVQKRRDSLEEMARETLAMYREAHKEITFIFLCPRPVPPFLFDRKQMERVLINLLDNAVAAVADRSGEITVEIRVDRDQDQVFLEVRDNGPGVGDEDKLHLFEPYFTTKKTGTGLGLAIATTVVADHGGYLRIKDNLPGGARFIVELPLAL